MSTLTANTTAPASAMSITHIILNPFDKLPAELRVIIYELVLARDKDDPFETQLTVFMDPEKMTREPPKNTPMPPLLHVCRQFRYEASPIFYNTTNFIATFDMHPHEPFPTLYVHYRLEVIGKENSAQIRRLEMRLKGCRGAGGLQDMLGDLASHAMREDFLTFHPETTRENFMTVWNLGEFGLKDEVVRVVHDGDKVGEGWRELE